MSNLMKNLNKLFSGSKLSIWLLTIIFPLSLLIQYKTIGLNRIYYSRECIVIEKDRLNDDYLYVKWKDDGESEHLNVSRETYKNAKEGEIKYFKEYKTVCYEAFYVLYSFLFGIVEFFLFLFLVS